MCRFLIAAVLALAAASNAWGAAGALRQQMMQPPGWVNQQAPGGQVASDLIARQWWVQGAGYQNPLSLYSLTRASQETVTWADGHLSYAASGVLAISDLGLQAWESRTNVVLQSSDLTQAAWTKSNVTAALDQTGPDNVANSASSIVATAGNGTVLQAITLASSARFQTAYVKRVTGSGTVNMTMDNGATWTAVTVTASWTRVSIPTQTLANPTVGFQIVTNGDKIAVFVVQNENGAFASPAIPTTTVSVTRAADNVTAINALRTGLQGANGAVLAITSSVNDTGFARIVARSSGGSANAAWLNFTNGQAMQTFNGSVALTTANTATLASTNKSAFAWNAAPTRAIVLNGGTVATDTNTAGLTAVVPQIGSDGGSAVFLDGNITKLPVWLNTLPSGAVQNLTR